ncbi:MAG: hypothetical protein R2730_03585 [Chitinophagales bacterium]
MKNYIYLLVLGCLMMTSCADDDLFFYQGETVVRFKSSTTSMSESDPSIKAIVLVITSPDGKKSNVSAKFSIEPDNEAAQGDVYTLINEGNTLNFEDGISDTIYLQSKNNALADGVKRLKITITEANVGIGLEGEAANFSTHIVSINDDDCALDMQNFANDYHTCEIGYQGFDAPVSVDPITANTLIVENLGDWGIADATLTFDPDITTSNITIENTQAGVLGGTTPVFWSGSGNYIACTGEFQVSYQIVFADGSPWGPGAGTDIWTIGENTDCSPLF